MWAMQYLLCDRPRSFITSGGLGTMGYGVPAAIGAKAARPDATVVCVDGDGCFQMTCQELATSVLEDLPIVVVIVNNGYLGMVRQWQDMFFDERLSQVHLTQHVPDYAKLAEAYGGVGLTVDRRGRARGRARRGARVRPHGRRRRRVDRARALLPDDPRRRRRARPRRVPGRGRRGEGGRGRVRHTLSVLVENKPGALMRISSMFARRGFNIESLAVGPTERHDVSRITLRVDCEQHPLEQIEKQMHKLVNVLRVSELEPGEAVERELALIKVTAPPARRGELLALSQVFDARVADLGADAIVFEVVGHPEEIDSFEELVRPHGIKELVRTGRIGLGRSVAERRQAAAPSARPHLNRYRRRPMATIHREGNLDLLSGKVAVLGYGSQGHAHALNLRDSGVDVEVGLREGSPSRAAAEEAGLTVGTPAEVVRDAQIVVVPPPRPGAAARLRRRRAEPRARTRPSSSHTGSTSTTAASPRPRATT